MASNMEMNTEERNRWVDETLNSLENYKQEGPMPGFYERVNARLELRTKSRWIKPVWVAAVAACFAMLITFNLLTLQKVKTTNAGNLLQPGQEYTQGYYLGATEYNY